METKTSKRKVPAISPTIAKRSAIVIAFVGIAVTAVAFRDEWLPKANELLASVSKTGDDVKPGTDSGGHEGHAHGHEGHDEANSIELPPQARKRPAPLGGRPSSFRRAEGMGLSASSSSPCAAR